VTLTGEQYGQFGDALRASFDKDDLERLLRTRLEVRLDDITLADSFEQVVFKVIDWADARGWTARLLAAARDARPDAPMLFAFSQGFGLASTASPRQELERVIVDSNSYLDVDTWRTALGRLERRVCRVEITANLGTVYGTGFLLGPDVVMTNHHVFESVILGEQGKATSKGLSANAADVVLRFDYRVLADGATLDGGSVCRLATEWLVDASPNSTPDAGDDPPADQLDYALVRLDRTVGSAPIGPEGAAGEPRGWVDLPAQAPELAHGGPLFILQHPDHEPLKLALATDGIIGLSPGGTRLRYRTNTDPGSSGAPCFGQNWDLVALHHSGDPNFDAGHQAEYNEGIPFPAILALLKSRGLDGVLGKQEL
jgi:hypothetical protein